MANDKYTATGNPAQGSEALTAVFREEFALIEAGFDKVVTYTPPNHTGDVTSVGDGATTIVNKRTMTATAPVVVSGSPTVIATSAVAISMAAATNANDGYATAAQITALEAASSKAGNATHTGEVTGSVALTISAKVVTAAKMADNTITAAQIANGVITATQLASKTVTAAVIADNTITASQIANGTITGTQIGSKAVAAANIADNTITATQIANGTITATQLAGSTITGAKIAATTVDTGNLTSAAKPLGVGQTLSADIKATRTSGSTYTNNTGRPIFIMLTCHNVAPNGITLNVDSKPVGLAGGDANMYYQLCAIVPAGSTYGYVLAGSSVVDGFFELA
jgi:hypothetical protein